MSFGFLWGQTPSKEEAMHSDKDFHSEQDIQRIKALRLIDDNFMNICFEDNIEASELLLKIIIGRGDLSVTEVRVQKRMENALGRSVVLDIYATDKDRNKYDIEVQRSDKGAIPKRARFHSSIMDVSMLSKSEDFSDLRENYVIFITEKDVLGLSKPIYHIERFIEDEYVHFRDGAHIIYVNASMRNNDTSLGRLMSDFYCTEAKDMNYKELADRVRYYKETEEGINKMCEIWDDVRNEALKEVAVELIKNGKLSLEDIAESTGLSIELIRELAGNKSA